MVNARCKRKKNEKNWEMEARREHSRVCLFSNMASPEEIALKYQH